MLGALHKGVSERLPRIDGHREWRQARASLDGYRRGLTAPTTTQTGGLTRRRAEEILSSNDHLDNAALGELRQLDPALDAYLTGRPAPDTTAASPTPAALNDRQLDALDNAALLHEWPASQVARKVAAFISLHAADSSPLTTDRRQELRASFTDIEDWEALDV